MKKQQQKRSAGAENVRLLINPRQRRSSLGSGEESHGTSQNRDTSGASEVVYAMIAAGFSPGPRSFHGLFVWVIVDALAGCRATSAS